MSIFVNRILNMRKIKAIGLDMDHTLVRYFSHNFEKLTHQILIKKLIENFKYPSQIQELDFKWDLVIRGLAIDRERGNLLKISRHGRVKQASHGTRLLDYQELKKIYDGLVIDLNDPRYEALDTTFSVAQCSLLAQLIDLKENSNLGLPTESEISRHVKEALDKSHMDGSLKNEVKKNMAHYIVQDARAVEVLERFKSFHKKIIVITNSDYAYTKLLLDYAINPFLKNHGHWQELFDLTITLAQKPRFFTDNLKFLEVDPGHGHMKNLAGPLETGKIYQGGSSKELQAHLDLDGEEILYLGDHIYGDILALKKACNWRTALVVEEIEQEALNTERAQHILGQIDELMEKKEHVEDRLDQSIEKRDQLLRDKLTHEIEQIDKRVQELLAQYKQYFNPQWGEIMRAGQEESRLMGQVEKYACIYMSQVSDFLDYSPRKYFRPKRRALPHEIKSRLISK